MKHPNEVFVSAEISESVYLVQLTGVGRGKSSNDPTALELGEVVITQKGIPGNTAKLP